MHDPMQDMSAAIRIALKAMYSHIGCSRDADAHTLAAQPVAPPRRLAA
jgi:hypothetical protein